MPSDTHQAVAVLANSLATAAIPATPCLTIFAFRGWAKRFRNDLPSWRNVLGLISIVATFMCWLGYVTFFLLVGFTRIRVNHQMPWLISEVLLLALGISSAVALKSSSRALILFAGLLMILLFWGSANF